MKCSSVPNLLKIISYAGFLSITGRNQGVWGDSRLLEGEFPVV